jgi:hypothetical protein
MKITEKQLRKIIQEEASELALEAQGMEEPSEDLNIVKDEYDNDPVGMLEQCMVYVEDVLRSQADPKEALVEAQGIIDDTLEEIRQALLDWAMSSHPEIQSDKLGYMADEMRDREALKMDEGDDVLEIDLAEGEEEAVDEGEADETADLHESRWGRLAGLKG